ncbi:MAG: hypothetical protein HY247_00315 [archaeon]|nr:MAG: hypothetical protein HY247_00315 [archaeon]
MIALAATDYTIVGTVLAISVAIILLSGIALYVSFRVKEALKEERGTAARTAKVALLIGLLFLSGGVFYFFAAGFSSGGPTSTLSSSSGFSTTVSSTSTSVTYTTASPPGSQVTMQVSFPDRVVAGSSFTISFTIDNNGPATLTGGSLDVGNLFYTFSVNSAEKCAPACASTTWSGSVVQIGDMTPGVTVVTLGLTAPSQPQQFSTSATLYYVGMPQQISATISIQVVSGHP